VTWYPVTANGVTFLCLALTLEAAIVCASVHIASARGGRVIERVTRLD
jgi:hypothetical protein